jgi:hypothetical protein
VNNRRRSGIDVDGRAAAVWIYDLETIDPPGAEVEEVKCDNVTRCVLADDAQDLGQRVYLAPLIEIAGEIVVIVVVGACGEWHGQSKSGNADGHQSFQLRSHWQDLSHDGAFNLLAITIPPVAGGGVKLSVVRVMGLLGDPSSPPP